MRLRYKVNQEFDYDKNSVIIILQSPYFQKEYRVPNIGNIGAVLSAAIKDFNAMHRFKIEELQDEEIVNSKTKKSQSNSKKLKGEQVESDSQ